MNLPQRLLAPAPGWIVDTDVVVVGSGIAGLTTALRIAGGGGSTVPGGAPGGTSIGGGAGRPVGGGLSPGTASGIRVMVVTKDVLAAGSTRWAQGGIAAAL
ncbi:MAG: L-aspartate oxidase, partial [Pseudonocardiales bacterium]|nr:L-aspartate oxidase [Pseudonocardiales bacterium]